MCERVLSFTTYPEGRKEASICSTSNRPAPGKSHSSAVYMVRSMNKTLHDVPTLISARDHVEDLTRKRDSKKTQQRGNLPLHGSKGNPKKEQIDLTRHSPFRSQQTPSGLSGW